MTHLATHYTQIFHISKLLSVWRVNTLSSIRACASWYIYRGFQLWCQSNFHYPMIKICTDSFESFKCLNLIITISNLNTYYNTNTNIKHLIIKTVILNTTKFKTCKTIQTYSNTQFPLRSSGSSTGAGVGLAASNWDTNSDTSARTSEPARKPSSVP